MTFEQLLDRHTDKIYFHPRTGEKFIGSTDGDRVHDMPRYRKLHLNGCPRMAYHQMVNQPRSSISTGKPTGQLKTVWSNQRGNFASFHQILRGDNRGDRYIGPQTPAKTAKCGNQTWKVL
jgi:hypothetical protein